jgi:Cof subfamily protein (haloacid dehalogenase superfamily)
VTPHNGAAVRLLALDLDGTLLDSRGRIPPTNLAAIAGALDRGVHVAVVTGRSYHFARPVTSQLPGAVTLILNNGAAVKTADGRAVASRPLPRAVAADLLADTRPWRAHAGLVFDRTDHRQIVFESLDLDPPHQRAYFERNRHVVAEITPLEAALDEDPLAVVFNSGVARMARLYARVEAFARLAPVAFTQTVYAERDFALVDVMAHGTSKGRSLAELAARLGVAREAVLAIGDNHNDADMLAWAGRGVVMGNATEELRSRGWHVTGTNDEAGVAQAITRFVTA